MLEFFLYLNLFVAGVAAALAIRYAYEHYISKKTLTTHNETPETHTSALSDAARAKMVQDAQVRFKAILEHAAGELQADLHMTSTDITGKLKSLGGDMVEFEMKRYLDSLEQMRKMNEESIGLAAASVTRHQAKLEEALKAREQELLVDLKKDIAVEKERRLGEIDKKLAGAVTAFLVETLGHNVDLGAQSVYLTEQLNKHKAELIKELKNDA